MVSHGDLGGRKRNTKLVTKRNKIEWALGFFLEPEDRRSKKAWSIVNITGIFFERSASYC